MLIISESQISNCSTARELYVLLDHLRLLSHLSGNERIVLNSLCTRIDHGQTKDNIATISAEEFPKIKRDAEAFMEIITSLTESLCWLKKGNGDIILIHPVICATTENFHDYILHLDSNLWDLIHK